MLNEFRTLVLNKTAAGRPALGLRGEEYIDPLFRGVNTGYENLRKVLYSNSADPLYQNFRTFQFLALVSAVDEVQPFLTAFDFRNTLENDFSVDTWSRSSTPLYAPSGAVVEFKGSEPDKDGICYWRWTVEYSDSDTLEITPEFGIRTPQLFPMNFTDGKSDLITLPGQSTQQCQLVYPGVLPDPAVPPWTFSLEVARPPVKALTDILSEIEEQPGLFQDIFHLPNEYALLEMWGSPYYIPKFAAIITALARRSREAWLNE